MAHFSKEDYEAHFGDDYNKCILNDFKEEVRLTLKKIFLKKASYIKHNREIISLRIADTLNIPFWFSDYNQAQFF